MFGLCRGFYFVAVVVLVVETTPTNRTHPQRMAKLRIISLTSNLSKEARNGSDQEVVFPEEYDVLFDPVPRINGTPKCAKGETFCENFDAYPKHHLKQVLHQSEGLREFFGEDEEAPFIVNRHGGLEEPVNYLCPSVKKTVFPKLGKNKNNKWKYIINQGEDGYIQGVRVETCRRRNAPCDVISDVPLGFVTSCKQKYMHRRLLSVSDLGSPSSDTFQLPSACCCSYKRDTQFLSRYGGQKYKAITPSKSIKHS